MLSRLPWDEELPRSWTAAMRPTPVMIPVNIPPFSQRCGGGSGRTSKPVAPGDPGNDSQVGADGFEGGEFERQRVVELGERAAGMGLAGDAQTVADELGGQIQKQLVDKAFAYQGTVELVAGFDMQFVYLTRGEVAQKGGEIHLAVGIGKAGDRGAAGLQGLRLRFVARGGIDPDLAVG